LLSIRVSVDSFKSSEYLFSVGESIRGICMKMWSKVLYGFASNLILYISDSQGFSIIVIMICRELRTYLG